MKQYYDDNSGFVNYDTVNYISKPIMSYETYNKIANISYYLNIALILLSIIILSIFMYLS